VRGDREIILKRTKQIDRNVNPYNVNCLRIWQGNMDIQAISWICCCLHAGIHNKR
jgi:hypothetical protein